jgi:membrane protease YdiL (CAAX protease family)
MASANRTARFPRQGRSAAISAARKRALACGSGAVGMGVGTAAFAAMHRYQGWAGMAANLVGGALLAALYMGTGSLWVAIAVHALVDLNALVLRPWVASRVRASD